MELNLTNQATKVQAAYFVKISKEGVIESSKEEML